MEKDYTMWCHDKAADLVVTSATKFAPIKFCLNFEPDKYQQLPENIVMTYKSFVSGEMPVKIVFNKVIRQHTVVATRNLNCGEIIQIPVEWVKYEDNTEPYSAFSTMVFKKELFYLLGPLRFLNHACDDSYLLNARFMNCRDQRRIQGVKILRPVKLGSQIFVNYGSDFFKENDCWCCNSRMNSLMTDEKLCFLNPVVTVECMPPAPQGPQSNEEETCENEKICYVCGQKFSCVVKKSHLKKHFSTNYVQAANETTLFLNRVRDTKPIPHPLLQELQRYNESRNYISILEWRKKLQ